VSKPVMPLSMRVGAKPESKRALPLSLEVPTDSIERDRMQESEPQYLPVPVLAGMRPVPKSLPRTLYETALRKIPWERIGNEVVRPVIDDISQGTEAFKDSVNSYMYRSTRPSDRSIEESLADHFRKFVK